MTSFLSQLTSKILIFKKKSINDAAGGFEVIWEDFLTLFSCYSYSKNKHVFTIRYRNDIKVGMKILANDSFYRITRIIEKRQKKSLELLTEEYIKTC